jgi:heat shock protein HslJ
MRRFVLLLAVCAFVGGCAAELVDVSNLPESTEKRGLAGHRFETESAVVDGQAVELVEANDPNREFLPFRGRTGGLEIGFGLNHIYVSGCDQFTSGEWEVSDGRLVTEPEWSSTARGCGNSINTQDQWLLEFLSSSPFLARDGDKLVLSDSHIVITLHDMAGINRPFRFS